VTDYHIQYLLQRWGRRVHRRYPQLAGVLGLRRHSCGGVESAGTSEESLAGGRSRDGQIHPTAPVSPSHLPGCRL